MATPELNKALAAFQAKLPHIAENATMDAGSFKNDYAKLDTLAAIVLPLLGENGLAYTACPTIREDGQRVLEYALVHASGEERGGQWPLPDKATSQQMGSAITYGRRYCLLAITGVHPGGEDDDGNAASEVQTQRPAQRRQRPPERPAADPVRTPTTGPDHERLRHGTVEATPDDRAAQRTKKPLPDDENVWQDKPAPNGNSKSKEQGRIGVIQVHFDRLGVTDRSVRLGYVAALTGHAVTSTKDLTEDEQLKLLDKLSKCRNRDALDKESRQQEVST